PCSGYDSSSSRQVKTQRSVCFFTTPEAFREVSEGGPLASPIPRLRKETKPPKNEAGLDVVETVLGPGEM
ncbi:hypothetical protein KUCAC02_028231, partial [Chaenocephalus aceratus]